ncbi:MAG: bifunctional riboflavin kinase/FAD synthetase [Prevotellaceae bacterium]|nr:bifunctional riboflavin kinase/FAD synthetase [Prevotellaceae bacterium]
MNILSNINRPNQNTVATIGFFDGVHLGHRFLLNELNVYAAQFGLESLVVSFVDSPQRILSPSSDIKLLTTSSEKLAIFSELGLQNCLMLNFDENIAAITSHDFLKLLHDTYRVKKLVVGYDHHFGSDRLGTFDDYVQLGKKIGVEVIACQPFVSDNLTVSSSKIRALLLEGAILKANQLLGSSYVMQGVVVSGNQIGRQIGFPTANLQLDVSKLIPKGGVYAVDVLFDNQVFKGMLNIGTRPTLSGAKQTIEVHIIDFDQDIYGETLILKFCKRLRDERKFDSINQLKAQLEHDKLLI